MTGKRADVGLIGIVVAAVRAHVIETVLVVVAALAFVLGAIWHDEPTVGMRVYAGEERTDEVDATYVSTLLEVRDGAWAVREQDTVMVPTLGVDTFDVEHRSDAGLLFPGTPRVWTPGGPLLRRRVPEWEIETEYRVFLWNGVPAVGTEESFVSERGWRMPVSRSYARGAINGPVMPTGFGLLGQALGFAPGGGQRLHVAVLTYDAPDDLADVNAWRALVAARAQALGEEARGTREPFVRVAWWRAHAEGVAQTAALAAVLRVAVAVEPLTRLREDLDRDKHPASGLLFHDERSKRVLDGALVLLSPDTTPDDDDTDVIALLGHFANPQGTLQALRESHAGTPGGALLDRLAAPTSTLTDRSGLAVPRPRLVSWFTPLMTLALIGVTAIGGAARVRRRDAFAIAVALVLASSGSLLAPHVTTGSLGLMALALLASWLTRRGAVSIARGVPRALAVAAVLLPLASATRLPLLDASGRAIALVGIAWLALGAVDPRVPPSDAPRRLPRRRDILWTSFQVLAVTGAVLGLLLAMLDPTSWSTRPPRAKWLLIGAGLVLALAAGLVAFARGGRARPQPAAICAVTMAAAVHVTFLLVSPFDRGELSGQGELGRIGMMAAGVAALFVVLRLLVVARAHRELSPDAAAVDHRPR